jgi:tRNA (cytidine/uridine-2'-O-)-methyltransferase
MVANPDGCPGPAARLALYQPDIPQNAGTMMRMAACLGIAVDIVEPAGFPVSDRAFRRAGLDYLDTLEITRHVSFAAFDAARRADGRRLLLLTTAGDTDYRLHAFRAGDILMVGRESAGVPEHVHAVADRRLVIPMRAGMRSLNVAVAAAMVTGEALRQIGATDRGEMS